MNDWKFLFKMVFPKKMNFLPAFIKYHIEETIITEFIDAFLSSCIWIIRIRLHASIPQERSTKWFYHPLKETTFFYLWIALYSFQFLSLVQRTNCGKMVFERSKERLVYRVNNQSWRNEKKVEKVHNGSDTPISRVVIYT